MQRSRWGLPALAAALASLAASHAFGVGPDADAMRPLPLLEPAYVEYRWTFDEPVWVLEPRTVDVRIVDPATRARRIDYRYFEVTLERRAIARVPEFTCKYVDFALPNTCRTTWRTVYADVPVPAVRHDYFDVDVPDWTLRDARTTVDWPRLEWKRRSLVVSLPAAAVYRGRLRDAPAANVEESP